MVAIVAVVVPEGLEPTLPTSGGDKASEGARRMEPADTRGTSSGDQADNTETWEETRDKFLHISPDELWKITKDLRQVE